MKTAWIAGATGLVGGHVLPRLAEAYDRVVAFTRRPVGAGGVEAASIETLGVDGAVDDVYCALGTTIRKAGSQEAFRRVDFDLPLRLAEAGLAHGARQFLLVSSVGADARSGNFYLRVKGELEERLSRMPFESLYVFRPSFLIGERAERRTGEAIGIGAAKAVSFALAGPLRIYRAIEAETVGAAMVSAAGQHLPGKHVYHFDDMNLLRLRLEPTSRPR